MRSKKNNAVTSAPAPSSRNVNDGSGGGGAQSCNLNFGTLANNMKLDTPIDLSGCNQNTAEFIQGKKALELACRTNNSRLVLRTDNKTVAHHRVENPIIQSNSFLCKSKDWWTIKDPNNRIGKPEDWDTETHPSKEDCASTCAQIKSVTDPTKNILAFPGNKQCLKVCTPNIETACNGLIGKKYGDADITKINIVYTVNAKNVLEYHCEYTYQK